MTEEDPTADAQARLLLEVDDPNGTIEDLIPGYWDTWAQATGEDTELTFLYTKRELLYVRLAEEVESTDIEIGTDWKDDQSQRFQHIQAQLAEVKAEIDRVLALRRSGTPVAIATVAGISTSGSVATGTIAATLTQPGTSPYLPDPFDPVYGGSPTRRSWKVW